MAFEYTRCMIFRGADWYSEGKTGSK